VSRIPSTLILLQQSDAVDWMLRSISNENRLEFSPGRSDRCWELVLNEFRCMLPGGPGDVRVIVGKKLRTRLYSLEYFRILGHQLMYSRQCRRHVGCGLPVCGRM
jgi:hypothetical protein